MKRLWIILCCLSLCFVVDAQIDYSCKYWFDQNHAQSVTSTFNTNEWQTEIDVGQLADGLHTLNLQVMDTSMIWSSPQSYMFIKISPMESLIDPVNMENLEYICWFDQDFNDKRNASLGDGNLLFNVSNLEEGLHTINIILKGETLTSTESYSFIKISEQEPLVPSVDMSNLTCHYWFDRNFSNQHTIPFGDGNFLFEVSDLVDGLHTINIMLEGETFASTQSYMFIKVSPMEPLIGSIDMSNLNYHCWFDMDYEHRIVSPVGNGGIMLDVDNVSDGLHTIHIMLEGEALTSAQTYMFYKKPELEDFGIAKWQYFLNGDVSQIHTFEISPVIDTLNIITLLPVETWPVRSSCFHFNPNDGEPYLNAKNEIIFRFCSNDDRLLEKSAFFVDYQVQQDIVANVFERNTTETFAAPRNNQITWFKLDAVVGDSLAFVANKACTMQLFAPSGEEVYAATASEAMTIGGCHAWEDGTYYLAVHDVTESGETISVTYNWVYRYSILAYDVHLVGNGGCSTITYQGNGFNSLLDAYLINYQNDTIHRLDIGHESNTTTTITFNFYEVNLGVYDAVFEFNDEVIHISSALEVQEPVDIVLTSTVNYPSTYLRSQGTVTYTYTITNNGNMSAYAVPIFVYISSRTANGISHLKFDGLDLASVISNINMDSLSNNDVALLKEWSEEIGDDHHFFRLRTIDEDTGDSILVRSNFFYANIAPFETKSLFLNITSDEPIDVWMTVPNDTVQPITLIPNRGRGQYCCHAEQVQCVLDVACGVIDLANLVASMAGTNPAGWATDAANCICSGISLIHSNVSKVFCADVGPGDFFDGLRSILDKNSILGWAMSCIQSFIPGGRIADVAKAVGNGSSILSFFAHPLTVMDCATSLFGKKPNCPPGDPNGGKSTPVNSRDPNDIYGYLSESGSHYMLQEIQNIHYEIEFENDTTLATAAAHTIIVRDTLDATKFDLNSLAAQSVTVGSKRMELNGEQTFAKTLDMRPELYVIAQVEQDYDPATGIIQWTISSLDPMTMEPTDNPYQGVLPVNYFGDGVGFIDYSVSLKQTFADGTEISNRAGIIFDSEELIMTPTWTNIVDAVKPTSTIVDVTQVADTLNFTFLSEDNRSGVWYHTLYYRNDSTEMEWKVKKNQILENNYIMTLDDLQVTEYFVLATDSACNREEKDFIAEYIYLPDNMTLQNTTLDQGWNWWSTYVEQNDVGGLQMMENSLGNNGLTIKSQDDFTTNYFETIGYNYWYGGLESVDNEQGYMINTNTTCNVKMIGVPASPSDHPITLTPNWNWIGYPVNQAQLLSASLGGFQPEDNDVMKSHSGFATYYDGYGWYPDDFIMTPGEGYLYKSNATSNKLLTYVLNRDAIPEKPTKEERSWTPVINKYAGNISVIAVVEASGVELRDNVEIAAFVNGECRGSAILRYFEPTDRYYAMLSIVGENGDVVDFEMLDAKSDSHITLHTNDVIGNLGNPMVLGFGSNTVDLEVYPNPVDRGQEFSLVIPQWEKPSEILITNALGEIVRKESIVGSTVKGLDTSGIYMVKIICASGNVYMNKLIVK